MATQIIEFGAPAGQTVTARLFAAGSDTMVATATATARTNATGVYTAAFTDLTPGLYRLIGTNAAGTLLCQWWVRTLAATGTYPATETPDADSVTRDRMGYLDSVLIASNSNRTVQVTGSGHVAASIHNAEPDSIPAGALTDAAIVEIQSGLALQSTLLLVASYTDTEIAAIKAVTDKINTGLVADGAVFQFTANMLELAPAGGGGGQAGPGADQVTVVISDNGVFIDDCSVWISSDAAGLNVIAGTLVTNSVGEVKFLLDAGVTYYLWAEKSGMTPITGKAFVAVADEVV